MLKLKNIVKEYPTGDEKVVALKDINIEFRRNEFVSILGHSGCGKTIFSILSAVLISTQRVIL